VKLDVARREIERHEERIVQLQANVLRLEEEVTILSTQRFFLKRFEGSDSDIQFYTVVIILRNGTERFRHIIPWNRTTDACTPCSNQND